MMLVRARAAALCRRALSSKAVAAAPAAGGKVEVPYSVGRTASNQLPVYTDYRNGGTRALTLIRHIRGSAEALCEDLLQELGPGAEGTVRPGRIELKGLHSSSVKSFLSSLGF